MFSTTGNFITKIDTGFYRYEKSKALAVNHEINPNFHLKLVHFQIRHWDNCNSFPLTHTLKLTTAPSKMENWANDIF